MIITWRRLLSNRSESTRAVTNVKWKLEQYRERGQFLKLSVKQKDRRNDKLKSSSVRASFESGISPQKTLMLLKARYDGSIITDDDGKVIDLHTISPNNLRINDPLLFKLFKGLVQVKKIQKRRIDDRIIMSLIGVTKALLRDSYFVANDVRHLLERDNDISRAMEVCRLAGSNGSVGINAILEWCLKRSRKDLAEKVLANRRRWGIPLSPATYVIYFSGLSDCHEWGLVTDKLAQEVLNTYAPNNVTQNVETFNAALKLLLKNYTDEQAFAWKLFNKLDAIKVQPDAQTFTIFLQGLKSFYKKQVEEIHKNSTILSKERILQLFEKQAILVLRAEMVFSKAMALATPFPPPTEDEINQNPQLLVNYRQKTKIPTLDIDRHLAVAYLLCFCEPSAGTSWSNKAGSHYWYYQQALVYLQAWVPEIEGLLKFASTSIDKTQVGVLTQATPNLEIKTKTDKRTHDAKLRDDILPINVSRAKSMDSLNPWVHFPPSPFSHRKDKRYLTGINRQLIDFARPRTTDIHKEFLEHRNSNSPRKKRSSFKRESQGINKFLLRILLDSLLRLGLYEEFYKTMWLSIQKWADIKLDISRLNENGVFNVGALSDKDYPVVDLKLSEGSELGYHKLDAQPSVIDIGLVEDFIHKIEEHIPRSLDPTLRAVEVLAAFSNKKINGEKQLRPRPSTFNAIFSMLNRDIYRHIDRNLGSKNREHDRNNRFHRTSTDALSFEQLKQLLSSLEILVRCIFARFGGKSMDEAFVQSYDNLIERLYSLTWSDAPESHVNAVEIHIRILRTGILMYKPKFLIDPRQGHAYSNSIAKSMRFVHDELNGRANLLKEEVNLMMCLRNLYKLEREKLKGEHSFEDLQMKIYELSGELNANQLPQKGSCEKVRTLKLQTETLT